LLDRLAFDRSPFLTQATAELVDGVSPAHPNFGLNHLFKIMLISPLRERKQFAAPAGQKKSKLLTTRLAR
jgi:hypothetical protein